MQSCWDGGIQEWAVCPSKTPPCAVQLYPNSCTAFQGHLGCSQKGSSCYSHASMKNRARSFLPQLQSRCFTSSLSVLIAEALEMIFMVAKHSNAAIAEMVRPCPSWKCFAAHSTVLQKGTRALWVQLWSLDPALNAQPQHPEPGEVTSVEPDGMWPAGQGWELLPKTRAERAVPPLPLAGRWAWRGASSDKVVAAQHPTKPGPSASPRNGCRTSGWSIRGWASRMTSWIPPTS